MIELKDSYYIVIYIPLPCNRITKYHLLATLPTLGLPK